MPSPALGDLKGVAVIAANNVWAVSGADIFHWDGSAWNTVPNPAAPGYTLNKIAAVGPDDIWIVGEKQGDGLTISLTFT